MRVAALVFGTVGALALFIGAIIAFLIGLSALVDSPGYADFSGDLLQGMGGTGTSYSVREIVPSDRDLERALSQALASGDFGRLQDLDREFSSQQLVISGKGLLYRLLTMGVISLLATIAGVIGIAFAMSHPKVAMWLMAPASAVSLLAIAVAYHSAPGLIILGSFAMVLFLWATALEYLDSTRTKAAQASSGQEEATAGESGAAPQEA